MLIVNKSKLLKFINKDKYIKILKIELIHIHYKFDLYANKLRLNTGIRRCKCKKNRGLTCKKAFKIPSNTMI